MQPLNTEQMIITDARHMPIVKAYAKKIGLVETIDHMVDTQMELSPGLVVFGMVLDTLSGRTPLYRLTEFFDEKDTELLLGTPADPERFCDYNLGRSMDKIFETGTQKIFSQLAQNALPFSKSIRGGFISIPPPLAFSAITIWPIHRLRSPTVTARTSGRTSNSFWYRCCVSTATSPFWGPPPTAMHRTRP
jgi:hypothetical protein